MSSQMEPDSGPAVLARISQARRPGRYRGTVSIPYEPCDSDGNAQTIADYARILWRRKWLLLGIVIAGTLLAFAIVTYMRPVYRATSSVLFQKEAAMVWNEAGQGAGETPSGDVMFQTQVELLKSSSLIDRVAAKLRESQSEDGTVTTPDTRDVEFAAESIEVSELKGTRLIRIQAEAHTPELAAAFANAVVTEFVLRERERDWARQQTDHKWLQSRVDMLRQKLDTSEQELSSYVEGSGMPLGSTAGESQSSAMLRLQEELARARADRFSAEARYEIVSKTSPESLSEVMESSALRDYESRLTQLRQQLAEATSLLTGKHYRVQQISQQIGVLQDAIEKERQVLASRARNEHASALKREQLLAGAYLSAVKENTGQLAKSLRYQSIRRELERDREIYDRMMRGLGQNEMTVTPTNIHVIDAALPPVQPQRPRRALSCYLAAIASTLLGAFVVLARENLRATLHDPGDSTRYLNVNELGAIPAHLPEVPSGRSALPHHAFLSNGSSNGHHRSTVELMALRGQDSHTARCFRATLASILFSFDNEDLNGASTIVVTSATAGEGKTTVASNLGIALARMGCKVLLVDAHHRNARLHGIFDVGPGSRGLRELLGAAGPVSLSAFVQPAGIPGLYLLPAGAQNSDVSEGLQTRRIADVLRMAEREYEFVLVDTPPVLSDPDARIWGHTAGGVVLVVHAGETTRRNARLVVNRLANDGIPLLGTVLNRWDPRKTLSSDYTAL